MEAEPFWELFCMTGEPLAYMLYRKLEDGGDQLPPILRAAGELLPRT